MKPAQLSERINQSLPKLRRSEAKVAAYVLNHINEVINFRIVDLALATEVSEPTVVRFCKAIGCESFQQFKLQVAQQIASSPGKGNVAVTHEDNLAQSSHKVFDSTVDALLKTRDSLSIDLLEKVVDSLNAAKHIHIFGFGASSAVATDAQHKLFRLNRTATAYSDPHIQLMASGAMGNDDVVIAISQSGQTKALIDSILLAQSSGATVVSLAPTGSIVSQTADLAIDVDIDEGIEIYTPLSSRIAHLVVIDVIAIGLARAGGEEVHTHLFNMQQRLRELKR